MPSTIRELIIEDVITQLATIRIANGFNTDIGQNVVRVIAIDPHALPAVIVTPQPDSVDTALCGVLTMDFTVNLSAICPIDPMENMSVTHEKMLGDLITCLTARTSSGLFSPRIDSIDYKSGGTNDYPEKNEFIGCPASFEIKYNVLAGNPYTQG